MLPELCTSLLEDRVADQESPKYSHTGSSLNRSMEQKPFISYKFPSSPQGRDRSAR